MTGGAAAEALTRELRARLVAGGAAPGGAAPGGAAPGGAEIGAALHRAAGWRGSGALAAAARQVADELGGLGPLQPLLADPAVSDVCVNGAEQVWVDRGDGLRPAGVRFPGPEAVRALAVRLAETAGRRLDDAQPFADARLPGGIRLHAALPPVAPDGPLLCLRTGRRRAFDLAELQARATLDAAGADLLRRLVSSRANFVVTGGAGSGKTTLLAALLSLVDPAERVVLVEDVGELRPALPHLVRLECRAANGEGAGEIGLDRLVREALRMRPDRIVVGECRGADVVELLAALNTGQAGAATVHANRLADLPARLEALAARAGVTRAALHAQLAAAVAVGLHVSRTPTGRRLTEIAVCRPRPDGTVSFEPAWLAAGDRLRPGPAAERFAAAVAGAGGSGSGGPAGAGRGSSSAGPAGG